VQHGFVWGFRGGSLLGWKRGPKAAGRAGGVFPMPGNPGSGGSSKKKKNRGDSESRRRRRKEDSHLGPDLPRRGLFPTTEASLALGDGPLLPFRILFFSASPRLRGLFLPFSSNPLHQRFPRQEGSAPSLVPVSPGLQGGHPTHTKPGSPNRRKKPRRRGERGEDKNQEKKAWEGRMHVASPRFFFFLRKSSASRIPPHWRDLSGPPSGLVTMFRNHPGQDGGAALERTSSEGMRYTLLPEP